MRLTIAFDDVSLPLPPMRPPDVRQRVIEAVLDMAAAAGVDDVVLIAALALHRRMTDDELRHALGSRIFDAFAPHGLLQQHDAEDRTNLLHLGQTDEGEDVELNRRAAESDLLIYVNINLVAMDGGHKSVATGLASYKSLRHHHNVRTMRASRSFMDMHRSQLHTSNWRMGKLIADSGVKVFQIETTLNNDTFPAEVRFLQRREWEWSLRDRASFYAASQALARTPPEVARRIFHSVQAPHEMTSVQAGEVGAVHDRTLEQVHRQQLVEVKGQTDILTMGLPYICPYNVNSIMNPILVACLGLGYFFNLYRNKPLVREGGVVIMSHPTPWAFNPVHHPSYIDFFEQVLAETTDMLEVEIEVRGRICHRPVVHPSLPDELRLPRRPPFLHVVLVRPRPRAPRQGDRGRRRPGRSAAPRLRPGLDARRRPRDGLRRCRGPPDYHPHARPAAHAGRRAVTSSPSIRSVLQTSDPAGRTQTAAAHPTSVSTTTPTGRGAIPSRLARAMLLDDVTRPVMRAALPPDDLSASSTSSPSRAR